MVVEQLARIIQHNRFQDSSVVDLLQSAVHQGQRQQRSRAPSVSLLNIAAIEAQLQAIAIPNSLVGKMVPNVIKLYE